MLSTVCWLVTVQSANAQIRFNDVTEQSLGIFRTETWGASVGDYNGDLWPDVFVGNHRERPSFYRNNGDGTFTDIILQVDSDKTWLDNRYHDHHGAAFADVDGDGFDDLHVSTNGASSANFAESDGVFVRNRASARRVDDDGSGWSVSFLDYNKDGRVDMSRLSFDDSDLRTQDSSGRFNAGPRISCSKNNYGQLADVTGDGFLDFLCASEAFFPQRVYDISNGSPRTVSTDNGLIVGNALDTVVADLDGDLANEIFGVRGAIFPNQAKIVSPGRGEAFLDSASGQGNARYTFSSSSPVTFTLYGRGITPTPSTVNPGNNRTLSAGGIGNDADLEIRSTRGGSWTVTLSSNRWASAYVVMTASGINNMSMDQSSLRALDRPILPRLLDRQGNNWVNRTSEFGFRYEEQCAGVVAADFDNDMDLDVYMSCRGGVENIPNRMYKNDGNGRFGRISNFGGEGITGTGLESGAGTSENVVTLDYDNDGFMDLFVLNGLNDMPIRDGGPHQLLRNAGNSNKWIQIELVGSRSSAGAIGARVLATAGGVSQVREQNGGFHRWSQNQQRIHFGLAANNSVDLVVNWPDSPSQTFNNVQANRVYRIKEGAGISTLNIGAARKLPAATSNDQCGSPTYIKQIDTGLFLYKTSCSSNRWTARLIGGQPGATVTGRIVELSGGSLSNASRNELESDDVLSLGSDQLDFKMTVGKSAIDGFQIDARGENCFVLSQPTNVRVMIGARHVEVPSTGFNTQTLQPCTVQGPLGVSITDLTVDESVGVASVNVRLSAAATSPVSVTAFTRALSGSAVAGQDFYGTTQTINFAVGETTKTMRVVIVNDGQVEATESFQARLTSAAGATILDNVATVTINDDDSGGGGPALSVSDQSFNEGVGTANIEVRLSRAATNAVSVLVFTRGTGSARGGQDFYGSTQTLNFTPGETSKSFNVTIIDDSAGESNETIPVRILNPSGATISDANATMTIIDND